MRKSCGHSTTLFFPFLILTTPKTTKHFYSMRLVFWHEFPSLTFNWGRISMTKFAVTRSLRLSNRVFIKYCVFSLKFCDFLNSASSAAALVFYLPGVCTHTDTEGKQRKVRVRNIPKSLGKTQYLMNTLYDIPY